MLRSMNQRRLTISHPAHDMALELQSLLQKQAQCRIIFNNQNSHFFSSPKQKVVSIAGHITNSVVCVITLVHERRDDKDCLQKFAQSNFKTGISHWNRHPSLVTSTAHLFVRERNMSMRFPEPRNQLSQYQRKRVQKTLAIRLLF